MNHFKDYSISYIICSFFYKSLTLKAVRTDSIAKFQLLASADNLNSQKNWLCQLLKTSTAKNLVWLWKSDNLILAVESVRTPLKQSMNGEKSLLLNVAVTAWSTTRSSSLVGKKLMSTLSKSSSCK